MIGVLFTYGGDGFVYHIGQTNQNGKYTNLSKSDIVAGSGVSAMKSLLKKDSNLSIEDRSFKGFLLSCMSSKLPYNWKFTCSGVFRCL